MDNKIMNNIKVNSSVRGDRSQTIKDIPPIADYDEVVGWEAGENVSFTLDSSMVEYNGNIVNDITEITIPAGTGIKLLDENRRVLMDFGTGKEAILELSFPQK